MGSERTVCVMGCGQFGDVRLSVASVRPAELMEATRMLCSPCAPLGMSGETAKLSDSIVAEAA